VRMKTRVAGVVAASGAAVALMGAPAFASSAVHAGGIQTNGSGSVLGGNQIIVPITAPINVCGNAIAILGIANASCEGGASVNGPLLGW